MPKPRILLVLDTDAQPSVFDSVVAIDAGVEQLLRHASVTVDNVRDLVYGAMFTRGVDDLRYTAIFVGGSDVAAGDALTAKITKTFFGPLRVSVMMDANGANTTAAAAVLAAAKHVEPAGALATVLGATGPVGQRVVRLLAREGASVRVGSRSRERAAAACDAIRAKVPEAKLEPVATEDDRSLGEALDGAAIVVAAGAPGAQLLPAKVRAASGGLAVAIDLNAVPPVGIEGIEPPDRAVDRDGVACYGAIGVGGTKMKIHKAALERLFSANDLVLDAEEVFAIGREMKP